MKFSDHILDQAVKVRRGVLKLIDVKGKDRDEIERASKNDMAVMTYLRLQRPSSEQFQTTPKPHTRGV